MKTRVIQNGADARDVARASGTAGDSQASDEPRRTHGSLERAAPEDRDLRVVRVRDRVVRARHRGGHDQDRPGHVGSR